MYVCLHSLRDVSSRKKNSSLTTQALQSDVSTQSDDHPIRIAARVGFPQSDDVPHIHFCQHVIPIMTQTFMKVIPPTHCNSGPKRCGGESPSIYNFFESHFLFTPLGGADYTTCPNGIIPLLCSIYLYRP